MHPVDPGIVWLMIGVITLPGFLVSWVSGLRLPWAAAAAIPVSLGFLSLSGWVLGRVGWRFSPLSVLGCLVLALALAAGWRFLAAAVGKRWGRQEAVSWRDQLKPDVRSWVRPLIPAVGVTGASVWAISSQLRWLANAPDGVRNIFQGWDVLWHASVVRWIYDTGVASATRTGELEHIEYRWLTYYPVGFHIPPGLVGQMTDTHPIETLNIASIVIPVMALTLSAGLLAWAFVGNRGIVALLAGAIAPIIVVCIPAVLWVGHYVGAWPYLTAVSLAGAVAVLFMQVPRQPVMVFVAALSFAAVMQVHPASVTIPVTILLFWWLLWQLWVPVQGRIKDAALLALAGGAGALMVLPQVIVGTFHTEEVVDWTTPDRPTDAGAWMDIISLETRHVRQFVPMWDPTVLLVLALVGGIIMLLRRRNAWAIAAYIFSAWLAAQALGDFNSPAFIETIAGLHYNAPHRLVMPVATMLAAAVAVALATGVRLLTGGPMVALASSHRCLWQVGTTVAALVAGAFVAWGTAAYMANEVGTGAQKAFEASRNNRRMIDEEDKKAWDWLAQQPSAYEGLIAGEPAQGIGWMYAYNGLPSLHRHYNWSLSPRNSASDRLYWHPSLIGAGLRNDPEAKNPADEAAEQLNVHYFYQSAGNFWAEQEPRWELNNGLWTAPGVTPVYKDDDVTIFAVDAAFTKEELREVIAAGREASPDEIPEVAPARPYSYTEGQY